MLVGNILSMVFSPVGKIAMVVLAFVAWTGYQRMDATTDCREDQLRVELTEANRQLEAARGIADRARERADKTLEQLAERTEASDALITELRAADSSCVISDDVRKRLLDIR